ncbi:EF-Hand 1, calcium-binding site [Phytophthora cactorum]|nr:EF-Hand 1, calcium-binding site [Phytophthora cactorum]
MGQLQGKATYLKCTTSFLNASERDVNKLWESFNDVAEGFGLSQDELVEICRSMQQTLEIHARSEMDQLSAALFAALDTDEVMENGLVDALEFLGTMAMMSAMPIPQKVTFVYNCYDFNETGQLSLDELTLAFKSTLTGLCKLCVSLSCPTELVLEDLAQHAFQKAQKPGVDVFLSLPEFLRFADTTPEVTSWVDYFDCPLETVDEQDGDDSDAEREAIADLLASSALDDDDTARKRDASLPQDAAAPDFTVDKMIPRHPWQLAVANATPSAPPTIDPRMPAASLELEWVYGYNSDLRNIVHYVSPAEAVYPAGSVVVVYDTVAHRQRFACHHSGLVQTLAVHPSDRRVIATGEAALIPKIVIWSTQTLSESGAGGGGGVLSVLRGFHRRGVSHLAWMPSGRTLVTVGQDEFHCVAVYQWEKAATSAEGNADLVDWSKPAELIFAGRGGREPVHALTVLNGPLNQAQFVTGGRRHLFFWTRERDARYPSPHALFARLPGVLGRKAKVQTILSLVALPGDSGAIAGTARGQLLLFEGRNCVRVLYAHAAAVTTLFAFTGGVLSGGKDGKVRIWSRHLEPGAQFDLVALGSSSPRVRSLVASPDGGAKLLIATAGAEIFEIASSDGANLHFGPVVCGHSAFQLHGLAIHPLRRECCSAGMIARCASGTYQLTVSFASPLWTLLLEPVRAEEEDEDNPTTTDPDLLTWRRRQQPKLVNPNKQGAFAVLNESSLAVKFEAKDSKRPIRTLRFSGDGLTLAVGSSDNCIYSYHTEDWASKGKCRARDAGVVINTFDFSTTGEHIMANARNRGEMVFFESSSGVEITRVATLKDVEWLSCSCPYGWGVQGAWPARKIEACEISAVDRSSGVETPMLVAGDTLGSLRLFRYPCVKPESLCQVHEVQPVPSQLDDVDGGNGDADDVPGTSDDEREVSHGDKRSAFDEAAAVGDFALELLAERLQDPTYNQEEQEETGGELPKATTPAVLAPSKPWVSSSVPPSEAPNEGDLELSTVPSDSLELEWVYGYRCHDVRNNLFLTRAKSLMVYPAANIVVLLDTKLWLQRHFKQHTDEVTSLTTYFEPSSKASNASQEIAASGQMGRFPVIHVWRIDSLEVLVSLRGFHRHGIAELRFNSAGNLLASVGLDDRNSLALFQQEAVIKGAAVTLPDDSLNPSEVPVTPVVIATVGVKSAAFWRLAAGRTLVKKDALLGRKGRQGGAPPSFLSVVYCGKDAIAGTVSGDLFRFKGTELSSIVPAHTRGVAALYSSSGATGGIASGGQDGLVKLWSADLECLADVELVYETRDTKQSVTALRFSPDGQSLVCGALDGFVYIYDVPSNYTKRAVFSKHKAPITHLDLASDSQYLRSNCKGFELFFADVTTGSHVASATALRNHIWDTCSTIYNWSNQGVWPVAPTGLNAMREITCCACSLPGAPYKDSNAILAAGNSHGAISVLKYPSFVQGAGAKTYYGHSGAVAQLGFSGAGGASASVSVAQIAACFNGDGYMVQGVALKLHERPEEDPDLEAEGRFLPEAFVNDGGGAQSDVTPFVSAMLPPSGVVQEPSEADGVAKHRAFELEHVFGLRTHDARQNVVYARPSGLCTQLGVLA